MILQPIINWIVGHDSFFDWFNFGCIILNLVFAFYIRGISIWFRKKYVVEVLPLKSRGLLDGIIIVEGLFLAALWSWMGGTIDTATKVAAEVTGTSPAVVDPSILYYIIAENGKSLYFMSVNFLIWREVKEAIDIVNKYRDTAKQNLSSITEVKP